MSENNPSGNNGQASGEDQKKDSVSYDSHLKLLNEKKKAQQDLAETKSKLEEYEQAKLEAEGKLKEALENQKKIAQTEKEKGVKIFKTASEKAIRAQFLRKAEGLGCVDADMAMKACDFSQLQLTEDFEFDDKELDVKIQELTKSKPYLFKKDYKLPPDLTPGGHQGQDLSLKDMKQDDLTKLLATKL